MKCLYCDGDLELATDVYHLDRKGIHLTIDDMQVYKCNRCGEIMIPGEEVQALQDILRQLEDSIQREVA